MYTVISMYTHGRPNTGGGGIVDGGALRADNKCAPAKPERVPVAPFPRKIQPGQHCAPTRHLPPLTDRRHSTNRSTPPRPRQNQQSVAAAAAATIGGPSPTVTSNGPEFQIQNRQRSSAAPPRLVAVVCVALNDYLHTRKRTCPGAIFFSSRPVWLVSEHKSENASTRTRVVTHRYTEAARWCCRT